MCCFSRRVDHLNEHVNNSGFDKKSNGPGTFYNINKPKVTETYEFNAIKYAKAWNTDDRQLPTIVECTR